MKTHKITKEDILLNGIKIGESTLIQLIDENGVVYSSSRKEVIFESSYLGKQEREQRQANIDNLLFESKKAEAILLSMGIQIALSNAVKSIFSFYKDSVDEYIQIGSDSLQNSIENETDSNIISLLEINVPRADGNGMITIKDSILYKI